MTGAIGDRHLSWPNLLEYLDTGAPAVVRIAGTPHVDLVIEPDEERIALRGPWPEAGDIPDLASYRHLATRVGTAPSGDWVEFAVYGRDVLREAYPMLVAVADHVQLHGDSMRTAIGHVLSAYRELLSSLGRLSEHQELGLSGEMLVLNHLIGSIGEQRAVDSWRGPTREEHDFGLSDFDMEVKTTLSEDRSHRISSLTQLEPSASRDLWLVSVQLTTSGVGGTTLPELIEWTMGQLSSPTLKGLFADRLTGAGWDPTHSHLYTRRFVLRSEVLAFRVTHEFPAITAQRLGSAGLPIERFSHVVVHPAHRRTTTRLASQRNTGTRSVMNDELQRIYLTVLAGLGQSGPKSLRPRLDLEAEGDRLGRLLHIPPPTPAIHRSERSGQTAVLAPVRLWDDTHDPEPWTDGHDRRTTDRRNAIYRHLGLPDESHAVLTGLFPDQARPERRHRRRLRALVHPTTAAGRGVLLARLRAVPHE